MVDGSCIANCLAYIKEQEKPELSIYSRYGLMDRMGDGFVDPPKRREWSLDKLYQDWKSHGFFNELCKLGHITVSYAGNTFIDFEPSAANYNRHQALAVSCFIESCYNSGSTAVVITSPHERGGDFSATFKRINDNEIIYTTTNQMVVRFRFDPTRPSQI